MSSTAASFPALSPDAPRATVPWTIWAGILAVTSASIGGAWDVAWHRSIGRDSFWTAPHIAIYGCGVLAAIVCGYLILYTTFGHSSQLRAESVQVLGFHAPLGAFIAAWGGICMITAAPFDNWWHQAYGLDVKIVSPPHAILLLGIRAVSVGVLFLILAGLNRASTRFAITADPREATLHRNLQYLFLYLGGLIVAGQMFFLLEFTWDIALHNSEAYIAMAVGIPVAFGVLSRASGSRWACTISAAFYTVFELAGLWIFPLVPASPKLGPVYFPVTHLVPTKFPILLIVPAIAVDLLWRRFRHWKTWQLALVTGLVFVAVLTAVEWPFASLMMTKAGQNAFFGNIYFDYNSRPTGPDRMREFIFVQHGFLLFRGLSIAVVCGAISAWCGLSFGDWMKRVQR